MSDANSAAYTRTRQKHWARVNEAGTLRGMQLLFWLHKTFGRWLFSALLLPVMSYFILCRHRERRASLQFLRTVHAVEPQIFGRKPGYFRVFQHFMHFGEAILDKTLAWSEDIGAENFNILDEPLRDRLLADPRGQLFIGSHLGNMEYCRGFMQRSSTRAVNALVYDQHTGNYAEIMQRINPASRISLFQVDQLTIPVILELKARIDRGEWLVMAGDRIPLTGAARTVRVNFMGREAPLPMGPYILARTLECPVNLMFCYRKNGRVNVEFSRLAERIELPRKQRESAVAAWAQRYADGLQRQVLEAPLQWFNFYDFWAHGTDGDPANQRAAADETA